MHVHRMHVLLHAVCPSVRLNVRIISIVNDELNHPKHTVVIPERIPLHTCVLLWIIYPFTHALRVHLSALCRCCLCHCNWPIVAFIKRKFQVDKSECDWCYCIHLRSLLFRSIHLRLFSWEGILKSLINVILVNSMFSINN